MALVSQTETNLTKDLIILSLRTIAEKCGYGYLGRTVKCNNSSKDNGIITNYRSDIIPAKYVVDYDISSPKAKKNRDKEITEKIESKYFKDSNDDNLLSTDEVQSILNDDDKNKYQTPRLMFETKISHENNRNNNNQNDIIVAFTLDQLMKACKDDDILTIAIAYLTGIQVSKIKTNISIKEVMHNEKNYIRYNTSKNNQSKREKICKINDEDNKINLGRYCSLVGVFGCGYFLRSIDLNHLSILDEVNHIKGI